MKRITAGLLSMVMLILTACANQSSNPNESVTKNMNTGSQDTSMISQDTSITVENTKAAGKAKKKPDISQTGLTTAVPTAYKSQAKRAGKVVSLDYTTKNYAGDNEEVSKTAYVYLLTVMMKKTLRQNMILSI